MSRCQSSLCKLNGCMFPQACPDDRDEKPTSSTGREPANVCPRCGHYATPCYCKVRESAPLASSSPEGSSEQRLAEIEGRASRATDGPWAFSQTAEKGYGANVGAECFAEDDEECEHPLSGDLTDRMDGWQVLEPVAELGNQGARPNAEFIAHAREDIPWLLAQVRSLREEKERANAELMEMMRRAQRTAWITDQVYLNSTAVTFSVTDDGRLGVFLHGDEKCSGIGITAGEAIDDASRKSASTQEGETNG